MQRLESLGLGLSLNFFFFICFFPRKVYREDEKVQKEKKNNDIEVLCIYYLLVLFSLGFMVVLVAINFYFILSVSHVNIFHSSLNGNDHFNIISKG